MPGVDKRALDLARTGLRQAKARRERVQQVKQFKDLAKTSDDVGKNLLKGLEKSTSELKKQNKLLKENLALAQKIGGASGGGPGGGRGGGGGAAGRGGGARQAIFGSGGTQSLAKALGLRAALGPAFIATVMGGIIGTISSTIRSGITNFAGTIKSQRDIAGLISDQELSRLRGIGQKAGFGPKEVIGQVGGLARAVGAGGGKFPALAAQAQMRAQTRMGIQSGESANFMGTIRRAGITGFGGGGDTKGIRIFQRATEDALTSGLKKSRAIEHLENIRTLTESAGGVIGGVIDPRMMSRFIAQLGQIGPGFQGARARPRLQALQQGFQTAAAGGGAPEARAMHLQAAGFGTPGGTKSFFGAVKQLEKGLTDPANVRNAIARAIRGYGVTEAAGGALKGMFPGLSQTDAEKLVKVGAAGGLSGDNKALKEAIDEAKNNAMTADEKMLKLAEDQAKVDNLQFDMGKELMDDVLGIQIGINELVREAVPAVQGILRALRNYVDEFREAITWIKAQFPGGGKSADTAITAENKLALKAIKDQFGQTPEEEMAAIGAVITRQKTERNRISMELGQIDASRGAMGKTSRGRAAFYFANKGVKEREERLEREQQSADAFLKEATAQQRRVENRKDADDTYRKNLEDRSEKAKEAKLQEREDKAEAAAAARESKTAGNAQSQIALTAAALRKANQKVDTVLIPPDGI